MCVCVCMCVCAVVCVRLCVYIYIYNIPGIGSGAALGSISPEAVMGILERLYIYIYIYIYTYTSILLAGEILVAYGKLL